MAGIPSPIFVESCDEIATDDDIIAILYDDAPNDVIDKVNKALAAHGLSIDADGEDTGVQYYNVVRK